MPTLAKLRKRHLAAVAIGALAFAFAYLIQRAGDNERAHYALVRALADGTPSIDASLEHASLRTIDVTRFEGATYAAKPPGLAAASVPPYLVLEAAGVDTTGDPDRPVWALHLWSVVLPAVAMLLLVSRLAGRVEPGYGTIAAATLGGATLALPFATLFFNHVPAAALGFLAWVLLHHEHETAPRPWLAALAGLSAGLAVVFEYPLGLVALALAAYFVAGSSRPQRAAAYVAGALLGVAPLLVFNVWAFGSPFHLSYEGWRAPGAEPLPGVFGIVSPSLEVLLRLLFDPGGIAPALALAIVGAIVLWRRGERWIATVPMLVAVLFLAYDAANTTPFGGASPGPRYLIPLLPFLAVPLAVAWRSIPGAAAGLAVAAGAFMAGATLTSPLGAGDQQVLHRLATGGYVDSVASFFGVEGGLGTLPFVAALAVAAAAALAATPLPRRLAPELVPALVAGGCWAVLMTQTPRLLREGDAGEVAVIAFACLAVALVYLAYRGRLVFGAPRPARTHPTGTQR